MNKQYFIQEITHHLKKGGVGILPTDTVYGIVASAFSKRGVERVYRLRKRSSRKAYIILINSLSDLVVFDVRIDKEVRTILRRVWPGKVSVVLPLLQKKQFHYLDRGLGTLAFRLPDDPFLKKLLKKSGPLVAPSANPEGKPPASTIEEAAAYFGSRVDFYIDGGTQTTKPSTLIVFTPNGVKVLRRGAVHISRIRK